jgi:NAD(P)H-dependent flavin oxidoreductase YrpB (nitropropane dioxygenase family)
MLTTPLCRRLGMTAPIFSVGMGALAGPTLAAAVSNAGACGVLGRVSGAPATQLRQQIRQVRALTDKPFGVNIILATLQAEWIDICLDERVPLLVLRNKAVAEWEAAGRPGPGRRPGEGTIVGTAPRDDTPMALARYAASSYPSLGFSGDIDYTVLYAGESCHLIHDIKPAAQIVCDMMREAEEVIERLPRG